MVDQSESETSCAAAVQSVNVVTTPLRPTASAKDLTSTGPTTTYHLVRVSRDPSAGTQVQPMPKMDTHAPGAEAMLRNRKVYGTGVTTLDLHVTCLQRHELQILMSAAPPFMY